MVTAKSKSQYPIHLRLGLSISAEPFGWRFVRNRRMMQQAVFWMQVVVYFFSQAGIHHWCESIWWLALDGKSKLISQVARFCSSRWPVNQTAHILVGGLEHFLFFHILGIIIPTDELIFFRGVGIPPTSIHNTIWVLFVLWVFQLRTTKSLNFESHSIP